MIFFIKTEGTNSRFSHLTSFFDFTGNNSHSNGSAATPEKTSVAPIAKEISANGAAAVVAKDDNEKIEAKVSEQNGVVSSIFSMLQSLLSTRKVLVLLTFLMIVYGFAVNHKYE